LPLTVTSSAIIGNTATRGKRLADAAEARLKNIRISFDGLVTLLDALRGLSGSFDHAFDALRAARRQKVEY
jgi:MoaA/NifB/PqqE/SkfB family radical SAM enzyme